MILVDLRNSTAGMYPNNLVLSMYDDCSGIRNVHDLKKQQANEQRKI